MPIFELRSNLTAPPFSLSTALRLLAAISPPRDWGFSCVVGIRRARILSRLPARVGCSGPSLGPPGLLPIGAVTGAPCCVVAAASVEGTARRQHNSDRYVRLDVQSEV